MATVAPENNALPYQGSVAVVQNAPPAAAEEKKKPMMKKDGIPMKIYKKFLGTCDPKVRKLREPYRCPTGFLVHAAFIGSVFFFFTSNFDAQRSAKYLSADDGPYHAKSAEKCVQPPQLITDTYRVDTDGTWSSRYAFWAPNGLVEASFFRFNASVRAGQPDSYDTFGADMVSGLVKINKEGGNQTLLEQLMTLTMKRFMVGGDQFSNTNSIAFTGDARTWLDRQEVFTELFAWNVGTATITDYCDVQMVSSVVDGYERSILPPDRVRARVALRPPEISSLARARLVDDRDARDSLSPDPHTRAPAGLTSRRCGASRMSTSVRPRTRTMRPVSGGRRRSDKRPTPPARAPLFMST